MSTKRIRNLAFTIHRYLGLALGLLIILIGITGSLLVFEQEIDSWLVNQQIETITPQAEIVSSDRTLKTVQAAYPDWKIDSLSWNGNEKQPLKVNAIAPNALAIIDFCSISTIACLFQVIRECMQQELQVCFYS
jgi:uncharacterized iron-regulated membrane protein